MEQTTALPGVTLGQYKGLACTRRVRPVSEKTVEEELRRLARANAPFVPVALPAARGMRVTLDFEGFLGGAPIPDSRMENVTALLGTGRLMPAAEAAVCGHCAGETFRFDLTYPDPFRVPELSGRTAQFRVTLHTVEQQQLPAIDDAFARALGFDSLQALREGIRKKKRRDHEASADRIAGEALLDMAAANLTAELPGTVLEQDADREIRQLRTRLARSGITLQQYCQAGKTTPEQLRERARQAVERRLRSTLAVQAIAQAEHITVSAAEVAAEYDRLAKNSPGADARSTPDRDAIADALIRQKVLHFLLGAADITSVVEKE